MSFPWIFDRARNQYCYCDPNTGHWVYFDPNATTTYPSAPFYSGHLPNPTTQAAAIPRPSDEELLRKVGRNVVLRPDARNTPTDLLQLGVQPHMRINGTLQTHGNQESISNG